MRTKNKIISIIASFRNEEENIEYFVKNIDKEFKKYKHLDYKIYFVNDFSTDKSEEKIIKIKKKYKKIILASMSKNYGGSPSIHYGFKLIPSNCFATVIDCDLQDPVSLITKTLSFAKEDTLYHFARRERDEAYFQLFYTTLAYKFISFVSKGKIVSNSNYFKIIPPKIIKKIKKSKEIFPYWNYFISKFSNKQKIIYYKRKLRRYGKSKFNIFTLNPWITFYAALHYFKLKTYTVFISLIFLNYLVLFASDYFFIFDLVLGLSLIVQIANIFFYTICNIAKMFIKKSNIIARLYK